MEVGEQTSPESIAHTACTGSYVFYKHCPYCYPCGSAPCEKGESCPAKANEVRIIPWPCYPPWKPYEPDYPVITYSQSAGYPDKTHEGGETDAIRRV